MLDTRISPTADAETILIVYGSLAGIYRIYGRYEKALALYKSLLENHPNHETSLNYNIACLYALRKQPEEAVSHLNHALKNDPSLVNHVEKDRDFDSIRQNESFKSCLKSHRLK